MGVAFTDIPQGVALFPAATLSNRQRCLFNFGKTPFAHAKLGFFGLHSPLTDADRDKLAKLFEKYKFASKSLSQSSESDVIKQQGFLKLGEDLGATEDTDPLLIVMAYKLNAKRLWEFSHEEFVEGLGRAGAYTLDGIRRVARDWQAEIFRTPFSNEMRSFYNFVFDYFKEDKKILSLDESVVVWNMFFRGRWKLYDKWLPFVQGGTYKAISRDTWQQLFEFIQHHQNDLSSFDPSESWPVIIDEFVAWLSKTGQI